jgi:hypothetical protein
MIPPRGLDHEINRGFKTAEIDAEVRELSGKPDREYLIRPVAYRLASQ